MAANTFECSLITPEAKVLDEAVTAAVVPMWDGQMGFLPMRAPIVGKLGTGELRLDFADTNKGRGGSRSFFVDEGFAQMVGNRLTVLAAKAIPAENLNESEAQAELAEAEARKTDGLDAAAVEKVRTDRQKAAAKLRIAREVRARGI